MVKMIAWSLHLVPYRNPFLQAENCENLFAAGDVCAYPAVKTGQRVRIEHWDVAMQQGRVAAQNMLGKFQPFTTTPFFWSGHGVGAL